MSSEYASPVRRDVPPGITLLIPEGRNGTAPDLFEHASTLVAVLFAAANPISRPDLARVMDVPVERVDECFRHLAARPPTGLVVQRHGDLLQLATAPSATPAVERFFGAPPPVRLSRAALESLSVIAYRQPVTRGEIDAVRGVNSDSAVNTLLGRGIVAEIGRKETVGRPALLATTPEFLQYLGLTSLDDLPPLPAPLRQVVSTPAPEGGA